MPRSSVTAFDSQSTSTRSLTLPSLDIDDNYAILERTTDQGLTVLNNITGDPSLKEFVSYKYSTIDKVQTHKKLTPVYPPTTKDGYQIILKDEFIQRTTEPDGTVHDDPCVAYVTFRTTNGANFPDGDDVAAVIDRLASLAHCLKTTSDAMDNVMVDRLIHGSTIPVGVR